jgi:hypothetical protein
MSVTWAGCFALLRCLVVHRKHQIIGRSYSIHRDGDRIASIGQSRRHCDSHLVEAGTARRQEGNTTDDGRGSVVDGRGNVVGRVVGARRGNRRAVGNRGTRRSIDRDTDDDGFYLGRG